MLDDAPDLAVGPADDTAVAGGVLILGGKNCGRGVCGVVVAQQGLQRLDTEERDVDASQEDGALEVCEELLGL